MAACKERYKKNESHTEGEQGTNWQQREKVTVLSEDEKDDGEGKEDISGVYCCLKQLFQSNVGHNGGDLGYFTTNVFGVLYSDCFFCAHFIRSIEKNAIPIWYPISTKPQFERANICPHPREM